jgi:hypothetical protein
VAGPADDLRDALAELRRRLDAWHDTVLGVAAETAADDNPLADPRLEAAADTFQDALGRYEEATLRLLGIEPVDEPEATRPDDGHGGEAVLVDDFFVHLVVGVREGEPGSRLGGALEVIDDAALGVVERLDEAGYVVPEYEVSRGGPDLGEEDEP